MLVGVDGRWVFSIKGFLLTHISKCGSSWDQEMLVICVIFHFLSKLWFCAGRWNGGGWANRLAYLDKTHLLLLFWGIHYSLSCSLLGMSWQNAVIYHSVFTPYLFALTILATNCELNFSGKKFSLYSHFFFKLMVGSSLFVRFLDCQLFIINFLTKCWLKAWHFVCVTVSYSSLET